MLNRLRTKANRHLEVPTYGLVQMFQLLVKDENTVFFLAKMDTVTVGCSSFLHLRPIKIPNGSRYGTNRTILKLPNVKQNEVFKISDNCLFMWLFSVDQIYFELSRKKHLLVKN